MSISYRFRKKELVLMLDLFGDSGSLEQKFGDIYIDRSEYDAVADTLHKKGFVTVSGDSISAENGMAVIMESIFSAPLMFTDTNADNWIYCCRDFMVHVRIRNEFGFEYLVSTVTDREDREELTEKISGRKFIISRGGSGEISGSELAGFAEDYRYE